MDTKLKSAEELYMQYHRNPYSSSPDIVVKNMLKAIKEAQRNAIEVAVQRCSKEADADYVVLDDNVEKIHDETIECGIIPIEVYVTTSSILDCKQKLFEENNLI